MLTYVWIGIGSALGGMARFAVSRGFATWIGETFPWGTMTVNVTGSFIIGFLATVSGPDGRLLTGPDVRQFLLVGFCGGYTTFSSFSLQTLALLREGDLLKAGANIVLSVVLCVAAVWLGTVAAALLNRVQGAP